VCTKMTVVEDSTGSCCDPCNIAKRLGEVLLSIWMIGDMVMDGVTTVMYYNLAQVTQNASTLPTNWTEAVEGDQPDVVSYWYSVASIVTWFTTPLVFMMFSSGFDQWDYTLPEVAALKNLVVAATTAAGALVQTGAAVVCLTCSEWCENSCLLKPFKITGKLFANYFASIFWVYIYVPFFNLKYGIMNLFSNGSPDLRYEQRHAYNLPEQFGEAIPMFAIAVVFFMKDAYMLSPWEFIQQCVTMISSFGSILIGIVNGFKVLGCMQYQKTSNIEV